MDNIIEAKTCFQNGPQEKNIGVGQVLTSKSEIRHEFQSSHRIIHLCLAVQLTLNGCPACGRLCLSWPLITTSASPLSSIFLKWASADLAMGSVILLPGRRFGRSQVPTNVPHGDLAERGIEGRRWPLLFAIGWVNPSLVKGL